MKKKILFVFPVLFAVIFVASKTLAANYIYPSNYNYLLTTNGFSRPLTDGDWYTSSESNSANRYHKYFVIIRPEMIQNWDGGVAIWTEDPDNNGYRDTLDNNQFEKAWCRGLNVCDDAKFQVKNFDGSALWGSKIVKGGTANDSNYVDFWMTWPGTYQIIVESGNKYTTGDSFANLNNDANGYMLATNGENSIFATVQGTIHGWSLNNTRSFYFFVSPETTSVNLKNFNMNSTGTVKYIRPDGSAVDGSVSQAGKWNNGDANSGGDTLASLSTGLNGSAVGLWEIKLENYDGDRVQIVEADDQNGNIIPMFESKYQNLSNFSIDKSDVLLVNGNNSVDHPFTIKNLFLTKDIINLSKSGTNANFNAVILNPNGSAVSDTDGDGNSDTGFLNPEQSKDFILRVTPKNANAIFDKTTITATSYIDKKVDPNINMVYAITKTTQVQSIGLAEKVIVNDVINKIITIEYNFKNYGSSQATNLSIQNNLDKALGTGMYQILSSTDDVSTLGSLNPGDTKKVQVQIKLSQYGKYVNQSKISGFASGQIFEDLSTNGGSPDPDGNNFPTENDLTYFTVDPVKVMDVTEWIDSVVPQDNGDYVVTYGINLSNNGNTVLNSVIAENNLAATYSKYNFSLLSFSGNSQYANIGVYNGSSNIQLLKDGATIAPGEVINFSIKVKFSPGADKGPFYNSVSASGKTQDGHTINTSSDVGSGVSVFPDANPVPDPSNFDEPVPPNNNTGGGSNPSDNSASNSAGVAFVIPESPEQPASYPVSSPSISTTSAQAQQAQHSYSGPSVLGLELPDTGFNMKNTVLIGSILILLIIIVDGLRNEERWLRKRIKKFQAKKLSI